jgi:hypothetical protein
MSDIGYIVVEFNQASGQPAIWGDMYDDREDVADLAQQCRDETAGTGRKERYAVGTVTIDEDEDQ